MGSRKRIFLCLSWTYFALFNWLQHRDLIYIEMTNLCWSTWFCGNSMEEITQTLWGSGWMWQVWYLFFLWNISGEDTFSINKAKTWHRRCHCNVSQFSGTFMLICYFISCIEMPRSQVHVISMYIRSLWIAVFNLFAHMCLNFIVHL